MERRRTKPITVTLTPVPDDGTPLPLSVSFKIEFEAGDPRQERFWKAFSRFLGEFFTDEEVREFLTAYQREYTTKFKPTTKAGRKR